MLIERRKNGIRVNLSYVSVSYIQIHSLGDFYITIFDISLLDAEAWRLKWTDIDFKSCTIQVTQEKRSKPRIFNVSNELIAMLNSPSRNSDKIFTTRSVAYNRKTFDRQRKRIAHTFGNPRLEQITLHTLRHWKATMLYHQTKDILYVMQYLGHKNLKNTLVYIQLEEVLFKNENEEFVCKMANTVEEVKALIEVGFG